MSEIIDGTIRYLKSEYFASVAADAPLDLDRIVAHNEHGTPISLRTVVTGALAYASSQFVDAAHDCDDPDCATCARSHGDPGPDVTTQKAHTDNITYRRDDGSICPGGDQCDGGCHRAIEDDRNMTIDAIRVALKNRSDRKWSVRGGTGTAWGWITITAPPARRDGSSMTDDDRRELGRLLHMDVHHQGASIPAQSDFRAEYIARARGNAPTVYGEAQWD